MTYSDTVFLLVLIAVVCVMGLVADWRAGRLIRSIRARTADVPAQALPLRGAHSHCGAYDAVDDACACLHRKARELRSVRHSAAGERLKEITAASVRTPCVRWGRVDPFSTSNRRQPRQRPHKGMDATRCSVTDGKADARLRAWTRRRARRFSIGREDHGSFRALSRLAGDNAQAGCFAFRLCKQPLPVVWRVPAFQHLSEDGVRVIRALIGAFRVLVAHPGVHNDPARRW